MGDILVSKSRRFLIQRMRRKRENIMMFCCTRTEDCGCNSAILLELEIAKDELSLGRRAGRGQYKTRYQLNVTNGFQIAIIFIYPPRVFLNPQKCNLFLLKYFTMCIFGHQTMLKWSINTIDTNTTYIHTALYIRD